MTATAPRARRGPYAKSAARRVEIVEAAIKVFASRGYHGGSLREIAREIGMSLTAVTHQFPNKEALLEAVLDETDRQGEDFAREAGLVGWTLGLTERNRSRPELLRLLALLAAEASSPEHPAHEWFLRRYEHAHDIFQERILADQAAGRISPDRDADFLDTAVIALWDGLQLQWLIDPTSDILGNMRRALTALIPEAIAAHDGSADLVDVDRK